MRRQSSPKLKQVCYIDCSVRFSDLDQRNDLRFYTDTHKIEHRLSGDQESIPEISDFVVGIRNLKPSTARTTNSRPNDEVAEWQFSCNRVIENITQLSAQ